MDDIQISSVIAVDAACVFFKRFGHSDVTGDGTSLVNLLFHVILSLDSAKFVNTIDHVLIGDKAGLTRVAVAANIHSGARLSYVRFFFIAISTVDGASLISHLVVGHPFESVVGVAAMTALVLLLARDDDLGGDVDIGPGGFAGNLYPIRDSRGGGVGPA